MTLQAATRLLPKLKLKPSAWLGANRAIPGTWQGWTACNYSTYYNDDARKKKEDPSYSGRFVGTDLGVIDLSVAGVNHFLWNNINRILFKVGDLGHVGNSRKPRRNRVRRSGRRYLSLSPKGKRVNAVKAARLAGATLATANVVTSGHYAVRAGNPVVDVYSNTTKCTIRLRAEPKHPAETFETIIPGKTTAIKRHQESKKYRPIHDFDIRLKLKPTPYS